MSWTLIGIGFYLIANVIVGLMVAGKVRDVEDYLLAGRNLPLYLVTGTMFATWFGSETIIGVSSEVVEKGWIGAIADPFGAALCLFLSGMFLVPRLFPMNLLTFGDLYRDHYGKVAEKIAAVFLIASYLGWIAAQFVALGLLCELMLGLPHAMGIGIGFSVVLVYTFVGGMWSIAVLDFFHNFVIIIALIVIVYILFGKTDFEYLDNKLPFNFYRLYPSGGSVHWLNYLAAWMVIGLGSLPQQDVFQRIMSSKNKKTAVRGSYLGAFLYLTIGIFPLLIATYLRAYEPTVVENNQVGIPQFILKNMPAWVSFLFIGALISAVLNCASAAILAPAGILSENVIRPFFPNQTPKQLLLSSRLCVIFIGLLSLAMAFTKGSIHELVADSSALSLVSLFVPMIGALYLKNNKPLEGNISMILGMLAWLLALYYDTSIDALLFGLGAGIISFLLVRLGRMIISSDK